MGFIADTVNSPEFAKKTPLEKAQSRRDFFSLTLQQNPEIANQFNAADDKGKQAMVDQFRQKLDSSFPDAFTTPGFKVTINSSGEAETEAARVPIHDIATEQVLARAKPAWAIKSEMESNGVPTENKPVEGKAVDQYTDQYRAGMKSWADNMAALSKMPAEQRQAIAPFIFERYGAPVGTGPDGDAPKLFGVPKDFIKADESTGAKVFKYGIPAALRTVPAMVAGVASEGDPRYMVAAGAAGEAAAQGAENLMGTRKGFSPYDVGLSGVFSAIPSAALKGIANPALNMAANIGVRSAEGAALNAGYEMMHEAGDEGKIDGGRVGGAAVFGAGLGALIGGFSPKIAALLAGKNQEDAIRTLRSAEQTPEVVSAQEQIEKSLGIGSGGPKSAADSAQVISAEHPPVVNSAKDSAAVIAADPAAGLQDSLTANQITEPAAQPALTGAQRQIEALDAGKRAEVPAENLPQLSPQAQKIYDQYGFVAPKLAASLAGGGAGFVAGSAQPGSPEERIQRGLTYGVIGAAGGYMAGNAFLSIASRAASKAPPAGQFPALDRWYTRLDSADKGPSLSEQLSAVPNKIKTALVTRFAPLDNIGTAIEKANPGVTLPDSLPMSRKFELVDGAGGKALQDVKDFNENVASQIKPSEAKDFDALLAIKRTGQRLAEDQKIQIEKARIQGLPPAQRTPADLETLALPDDRHRVAGETLQSVDDALLQLRTKLGQQRFTELDQLAAGSFQHEMDANLQLQVQSGRLSQEAYSGIKAGNDFYAPFRVLSAMDGFDGAMRSSAMDTRQQIAKVIKGIDDQDFTLDSPTRTAAEMIYQGRILAEKNLKMQELAKLADADTSGTVIRKIQDWQTPRKGYDTVNYFENGTPMRLEVNPDVAEVIKGMNPSQTGVIGQFAQKLGSTFKFGATAANAAFQVRSIYTHTQRLMLMSKYGFGAGDVIGKFGPLRPIMDFGDSLLSSIKSNILGKDDDLARQFYESGAAGSSLQDAINRLGGKFDPKSAVASVLDAPSGVVDKIEDFSSMLLEATKMMGFKRGMRIEGINTLANSNPALAAQKLQELASEVRNYAGAPDFARHGNLAKDMNMAAMFFNARLQYWATDAERLLGSDGGKTAGAAWLRLGAAAGVPAAYFWYRNHMAENAADFDKRPDWEKQNYELIPRSDDNGAPLYSKDAQGAQVREYWRIPKREMVKTVSNLTAAALDFSHSQDPDSVKRFGVSFLEDISPMNISGRNGTERMESMVSNLNPAVKTPYELMNNRDTFQHRDIVPASKQGGTDPTLQYFPNRTPDLYVKAAKAMPQMLWNPLRSPLMLQQAVQSMTGGAVTQFAPNSAPPTDRDPTASAMASNPVTRTFVSSPRNDNAPAVGAATEAVAERRDSTIKMENDAAAEIDKIKALPPEQRQAYGQKLATENPALMKAILKEADMQSKGFDAADRAAHGLGTKDGTRAAYIVKRIQMLKTPEEKRAFAEDQVKKGLLTPEVWEQMVSGGAAAGSN